MNYDIPRRIAPAMHSQVADLEDAYEAAARTSAQAATVLGAVAVELGVPTRVLALARAAALHQRAHGMHRHQYHADPAHPAEQPAQPGSEPGPGPVAQAVMQLGPADGLVFLRADAIDRAARGLLAEVARTSSYDTASTGPPASWWLAASGEPAQVCANDFPSGPAAWLAKYGPDPPAPETEPARRPHVPHRGVRHSPNR
jgi:hypothetical protein